MDGMPTGLRAERDPGQTPERIDRSYRLDDRYSRADGQVHLSGTQAPIRPPLPDGEQPANRTTPPTAFEHDQFGRNAV